ncbi:MAG: 30S ribosomal protein S6 [Bacillota bacterium]
MNLYEVMYIIKPDIEGEELEEAITRVSEVMEKEGGKIGLLKKTGKRKLAYEIDDYKEGYYVLLNVQAEPVIVPALEHFFKVTEGYLRYIVIRLDADKKKEIVEKKEAKNSIADTAAVEE